MNINLYENKSGHYEHIYFIIKPYENKSGHYCNLGHDWSHWTLSGFPYIPFVCLVNSVGKQVNPIVEGDD
jgi:hypothetical protein